MRTLGLVLALLLVSAAGFAATTYTMDIYEGDNVIAAPGVPFNPVPYDWDPGESGVFQNLNYEDQLEARLKRWDPTFGYITYPFDEEFNILLGEGYNLGEEIVGVPGDGDIVGSISFVGVDDGVPDGSGTMTDMWISLPGAAEDPQQNNGGVHLIGYPFNHDLDVGVGGKNVKFTDGTQMLTWEQAVAANWVEPVFVAWDSSINSGVNISYDIPPGDDTYLYPGKGYWVTTKVDNLAMVILAVPEL